MKIQKFKTIKCPVCGKEKIISSLPHDWTYRVNDHGLNEPIEPVTLVLKEDEDDRTTNDKRYR